MGVPAGTWTVNVCCVPSSSVTVTEHSSAFAIGSAATHISVNTEPPVAIAILSFRLTNTLT